MFLSQDESVRCTVDFVRVPIGKESQSDHRGGRSEGNASGTPHSPLCLYLIMRGSVYRASRMKVGRTGSRLSGGGGGDIDGRDGESGGEGDKREAYSM